MLDNDGADAALGTLAFGAKGTVTSSDVVLLNAAFSPIPSSLMVMTGTSFSLAANTGDGVGDYSHSAPDGMRYIGGTSSNSSSDYVSSLFYTAGSKGYVGTGTFNLTAGLIQWIDYGSIGGIEYGVNPVSASGSVEVIYTYTPEPATLTMMVFGSLILLRKRPRRI